MFQNAGADVDEATNNENGEDSEINASADLEPLSAPDDDADTGNAFDAIVTATSQHLQNVISAMMSVIMKMTGWRIIKTMLRKIRALVQKLAKATTMTMTTSRNGRFG